MAAYRNGSRNPTGEAGTYIVTAYGKPRSKFGLGNDFANWATEVTYEVDALRSLMLNGNASDYGLTLNFVILIATTAALIVFAARMYRRMGY